LYILTSETPALPVPTGLSVPRSLRFFARGGRVDNLRGERQRDYMLSHKQVWEEPGFRGSGKMLGAGSFEGAWLPVVPPSRKADLGPQGTNAPALFILNHGANCPVLAKCEKGRDTRQTAGFQPSAQSSGERQRLLLGVALESAEGLHDEVQQPIGSKVAWHYSDIFHVIGKLHGCLFLERAVSVALQNSKDPLTISRGVPVDKVGFAVGIEIASGKCPSARVGDGVACMVVDGLLKGPIAIA
jgi:hypothetical protein